MKEKGLFTTKIKTGSKATNSAENEISMILFFLRFEGLFTELISIAYRSPAVSIELLPMMDKLSGGAILNSTAAFPCVDIASMIFSADRFFAQKMISSIL